MRRKRRKGYRKYDLFEATYSGYRRAFSNAAKAGRLASGETALSKEEFYAQAMSDGATYADLDGTIRFDPAKLRRMSAQAIATATGGLTTDQARRLKSRIVRMSEEGQAPESLAGLDASAMGISEFKRRKDLVKDVRDYLISSGSSPKEAGETISSEIFGS